MTHRKVIIDTDPGVDDAIAIFMALASPDLDIVGLTTVFGNAATDVTTRNALLLLEAADRTDIPVVMGEGKPLAVPYLGPVPHVHGANGLGGAPLNRPTTRPVDEAAADFMHATAADHPGQVTLLAVGPLTNLAVALQRHPDLAHLVAEVVVMGGNATVPGNATPSAEANINNDPEAADLVFGADWHVTMVGLDVTHQIVLPGSGIDRISAGPSASAKLLAAAIPHYRDFFFAMNQVDGIFVHDPAAVAYLIDPDAFVVDEWPVRVETESFSRGKTWPNMANPDEPMPPAWRGRPTVGVCTGVDSGRVLELLEQLLADA